MTTRENRDPCLERKRVAVIVAHPDDETLWAGGTILMNPEWDCVVVALCRASDADRAPRFRRAVDALGARGAMGDADDGPDQLPLPEEEVQGLILTLLPETDFDLVLTHGPRGEYTRHRRHEEVCRAVVALWGSAKLATSELWMFAYEDGGGAYLPRPADNAHILTHLQEEIRKTKCSLVMQIYGFDGESWEAQTTPASEAFRRFTSPDQAERCVCKWGPAQ